MNKKLVINKGTCPKYDDIIYDKECKRCKFYKNFTIINGERTVFCEYNELGESYE